VIIFGILAAVGRNKNVRLLGLGMIIAGVCALLNRTGNLLVTLVDKEVLDREIYFNDTYDNIVLMSGLIVIIISTLGRVLVWQYAHKEYGTKPVWCFVVVFLPFIGTFLQVVLNKVLMPASHDNHQFQAVSIVAQAASVFIGVAVSIIYMLIFMKNKDKEKAVPLYWLFQLLFAMLTLISYLMIIGNFALSNAEDAKGIKLFTAILSIPLQFVQPAAAFYLFRRQFKKVEE
jgi:hypothetical protein